MKHNWGITSLLLAIFILAQLVGLLITQTYIDVEATEETGELTFEDLPLGIERPEVNQQVSFVYILAAVLIGTAILFLLMKFQLGFLWKAWYFLAIFISLTFAFGAFISSLWATLLAVIIATWKLWKPNIIIHNVSELFIYGGLAAIFVPIMNIFSTIMLLLLISIYDMYAVWKSKHMVTLAKFQTKNHIFAGFYIPYRLPTKVKSNKKTKKATRKQKTGKAAILGGGDIAFPLIFAGVVLKTFGFLPATIISLGAAVALLGLLTYGKKDRFYPAMPFITVGCLLGYGFILLL